MPSLWFDVDSILKSLGSRVELRFAGDENLVNPWSALGIFNRRHDGIYVVLKLGDWSKLGDINCDKDEVGLCTIS
jgi:hypothetical protein